MNYKRTPQFWQENRQLSGRQLAQKFGGNDANWRRAKRKNMPKKDGETYVESVEIRKDGAYYSDKLLRMNQEDCKDPDYLLIAHGFEPSEWELVTAKNNIWNVHSDEGGVKQLYASKITVRPSQTGFDMEAVAAALSDVQPISVSPPKRGKGLLEFGNVDMHLGNSTLTQYKKPLARMVEVIESREWAEVVIPVGSDLFHCDNFKNTTSNGTLQSSVAWPEAWADAAIFFSTLIESALEHGKRVYCYYIIGNHDESMAWAFCQYLAAKYPQVQFDLGIDERKVHVFGNVAIGMTHGDNRTRKDLDRIFMAEFHQFAGATTREVHAGHYHHEMSRDDYGVVVRALSTAARTDKWHREEGYVGACKRFMVFEFSTTDLEVIRYV